MIYLVFTKLATFLIKNFARWRYISPKSLRYLKAIDSSMLIGSSSFLLPRTEKNICLICRDTVASNKRGNLERHYNTEHGGDYASIVGEAREIKLDQMKKSLTNDLAQHATSRINFE